MDTKAWQYQAIGDLRGYVAAHGGAEQEERLLAEVGDWLGSNVLGTRFHAAIGKGPAIVTVDIPEGAQALAMLPIEVARLGQRTLHDHRVTLVSAVAEDGQVAGDGGSIGDCLHVLAIFPAPPGVPSLNQQRARRAMGQSFTELGHQGKAVAFRPVQYDVTAEKVNDALLVNPGFDIVHICGYGIPGLLKVPRRKPARSSHSDIAGLLEINYGRVKLVTISPCVATATAPAPMTSAWMGEGTSWAVDLARRLDCAVLTFRFPIPDEFACDYFREFYRLLVASGQPVASAAAMALSEVRDSGDTMPPLAVPVIFGSRAADRTLTPPSGQASIKGASEGPPQFVGRDEEMRQASAALAWWSGYSGVMVYGLPGAGKTTFAEEIARTTPSLDPGNTFTETIWHPFPSDPSFNATVALERFAEKLDGYLPLGLPGALNDRLELTRSLDKLTEILDRDVRYLIVLDNLDVLLTDKGGWRDERWASVISALSGHSGYSRVLITSRRQPPALDARVSVVHLRPFPEETAILAARGLGGLRSLLDGKRDGVPPDAGRQLGHQILRAARGHPELLRIADASVGDDDQLARLLAVADQVWQRRVPFDGAADATGSYVHVMEEWARAIAAALPAPAQVFFSLLCAILDGDRGMPLIADVWPRVAGRLCPGHPLLSYDGLVDLLAEKGLAMREAVPSGEGLIAVHPVLAAYGRGAMSAADQETARAELIAYWCRAAVAGDPTAILQAVGYLSQIDDESAQRILTELAAANDAPEMTAAIGELGRHARQAYTSPQEVGDDPPDAASDAGEDE